MPGRHFYASLSREERLRRVGELLSKAVTLAQIREGPVQNPDEEKLKTQNAEQPSLKLSATLVGPLRDDDWQLLRKLAMLGEIAPREAMELWRVSRVTAYRRLVRLEKSGFLTKRGETTATRFYLTPQGKAHLLQMRQAEQGKVPVRANR